MHKAIEEKNIQLQVLVNSLASENQNMKVEIDNVKRESVEIKNKMKSLEATLLEMGKIVSEMRKGN